jgi:very-short-patch-repair endonuclease
MPARTPGLRLPPTLLRHARESRHAPTAAEQRIWKVVRNHQLGFHIRRQHALLGRFIADFYCAHVRLCIEIDGDTHADPAQAEYDLARSACLAAHGVRTLRFTNAEVMKNLPAVLDAIREVCQEPPP